MGSFMFQRSHPPDLVHVLPVYVICILHAVRESLKWRLSTESRRKLGCFTGSP